MMGVVRGGGEEAEETYIDLFESASAASVRFIC